ncbi:MAG: DUF5682 family protein [Myxococcales bacterium]
MTEGVHLFGIRHHGPGSARALRAALDALDPDALLIEGPPDGDDLIRFAGDEHLTPPVALLVYPPDAPARGVFYPFAVFSPEWQALAWAARHRVPARFMDLPQAIQLASSEPREPRSADPLEALARAAGYEDPEQWWEQKIEQRLDPVGLFAAVQEAMAALRATAPGPDLVEERREAHMRRTIRAVLKQSFRRIAVVCGAWHAPALAELGPAKTDDAILKALPKIKVEASWIPWTHSRLSFRSGYGAGVGSPGWYAHLWTSPDRAPIRWVAQAAQLLRGEDLDASSASVIDTVRLAETLAALRDRPMAGLAELRDATLAILCGGDPTPLQLVHDRLEIGESLGEVPSEAPAVPLQRDLEARQRSLRLRPTGEIRELDLDLRKENDRERSRLLHRLRLLGIDWGEPVESVGKIGTFHELWRLRWDPQMALAVVEASVFGQTVESAAAAAARKRSAETQELPALAALLDLCILAEVEVGPVLERIQEQAALHSGAASLMAALVPLARAARYGDVRGTPKESILPVLAGLFERALIALPAASTSLDDDAAAKMLEAVDQVEEALRLTGRDDFRREWLEVLASLRGGEAVHGLLRGRFVRLLHDSGTLDEGALHASSRLALSTAVPAAQAAAWLTGLLRGGAVSLLHQDGVWRALDRWLVELSPEAFAEAIPLVRRAFATFHSPELRAMGEKVKRFDSPGPRADFEDDTLDAGRADRVLPVLAQILGTRHG